MWRIPLLLLFATCLAAADTSKIVPSGEEVAILERLNEHRAGWVEGDARITEAVRVKELQPAWDDGKWGPCVAGAGQSPPLVFNPTLIAIARSLLEQHATQTDGTRYDAGPIMKSASYAPDKPNLAMFAYDQPSLSMAYETAMTNIIAMVPSYNNTTRPQAISSEALKADYREAGVAVDTDRGKTSMVIVLGAGLAKRYLGGIIYVDANRDHRYGLEEGKAGVVVTSGLSTATTSSSGAWWLSLDSTDETTVTFKSGDQTLSTTVPKGPGNMAFNWRIPPKNDLKDADRLIAEAEKAVAGTDDDRTRVALVKLLVGTRMKILDDDRLKHIATLADPVQSDFDSTLQAIEGSLSDDPDDIMKIFKDQKNQWKNAINSWFKSAENLAETHQMVVEYLSATADQQPHLKDNVIETLKDALTQPGDPSFLEQYINWLGQVDRAEGEVVGPKTPDQMPAPPAPAVPK